VQAILENLERFINYAPYVIGFGLLSSILFIAGYLYAGWSRRRSRPKPDELEHDLVVFETQHQKMVEAVVRLYRASKVPAEEPHNQTAQKVVHSGPRREGWFKALFAKISTASDASVKSRLEAWGVDSEEAMRYLNRVSEYFERRLGTIDQNVHSNSFRPASRSDSTVSDTANSDSSEFVPGDHVGEARQGHRGFSKSASPTDHSDETYNSDKVQELVTHYNRAVVDGSVREEFREKFQPLRVGTVNAEERTANPTIPSQFRETTDGDFFAMLIPESDSYAVLPRLGLTIEAFSYGPGALGEVFDKTRDYDPQHFYSRYSVVSHAEFKRSGEQWALLNPGELNLGLPD
jgi:hypothetical protein